LTRNGLPLAALERLRDALAPGGQVVRVRPLRGGISSSVHLVRLESASGERKTVVVRRYGEDSHHTDPAASEREFRLLEAMAESSFPAPRPLLLDASGGPFGAPTVVMSRLPGRLQLAPRDVTDYIERIARLLVHLHRLPVSGLEFLPDQRDVVGRTLAEGPPTADDPLQHEVWDAVVPLWPRVRDSRREWPRALVHGDYWPGNTLWRRGRIVGLVDWEEPRLGDPAQDVATCRGDLTIMFGLEAAGDFLRCYESLSGSSVANLRFWDLLISTWAVRDILEWAVVYPVLERPDVTPDVARERVRAFARAALSRSDDS
jgi:aminoglycoside phosphotransferase (APT) family kinase protein